MANDVSVHTDSFLGPANSKIVEGNRALIKLQGTIPQWQTVGAARYRQMRENGETALPGLTFVDSAQDVPVPSRESGRTINGRLLLPEGQQRGQQRGVFMHIHGGGWVLMSEKYQDHFLKNLADQTGLAVLSIGYRLAPEHPFPAGPEDCYDAAEWLVDNATKELGGPLQFVGGESAGGHLSALVILHLLQSRPEFRFKGALLTYGCYNLSTPFPSRKNWKIPLVLPPDTIKAYMDAFLPDKNDEQRADPSVSPINSPIFSVNEDTLDGVGAKGLPPALFVCGTADPLIDDTVFMSARWQMAGAEAEVKIYRGMPHGFNLFPEAQFPGSQDCFERQVAFLKKHM